ncbi:MAG: EBNA-1 nuclear protein [Citromicrobium sp.]|nr:EBNA-1 nuclear protein [Citromicrobium sp.]|tara:strand:+ start:5145 stop:6188 length:1044 start_codon:yes stop_codon:yes gene_type:complete
MNAPIQHQAHATVLPKPYLLFLGDITEKNFAKTAFGLVDWAPELCVGELTVEGATVTAGLERMSPEEAVRAGAKSVVIGVANQGGVIPESWRGVLAEALEAGLDVVSGLHTPLGSIPLLEETAKRTGRRLIDIRRPPPDLPVGTGRKRSGKRLLTVGTDCALGKKYTALAISREFRQRGLEVDFRATGQTGIMISGSGIPMDAVVSDFESGAAEVLSPDAPPDHWDVIEGQGSLFNPAYAAVSLGLLHGSQPDVFVVCHDPTRETIIGLEGYKLPTVEEVIDLTIRLGSLTNPAIRCAGISMNTSSFSDNQAEKVLAQHSERLHGMPVADPIRGGRSFQRLIDSCLV